VKLSCIVSQREAIVEICFIGVLEVSDRYPNPFVLKRNMLWRIVMEKIPVYHTPEGELRLLPIVFLCVFFLLFISGVVFGRCVDIKYVGK